MSYVVWFALGAVAGGLVGLGFALYLRSVVMGNAVHVVKTEPRISGSVRASMVARIRGVPLRPDALVDVDAVTPKIDPRDRELLGDGEC